MVIIWTKPALNDLREFHSITKKDNVSEYIKNLLANVSQLKAYPSLGTTYAYIKKNIIRKLVHDEHTVLYYVKDNTIFILAVIHHKQDINKIIKYIKNYFSI